MLCCGCPLTLDQENPLEGVGPRPFGRGPTPPPVLRPITEKPFPQQDGRRCVTRFFAPSTFCRLPVVSALPKRQPRHTTPAGPLHSAWPHDNGP